MQKIGPSVIKTNFSTTLLVTKETKIHSFNISILQETNKKCMCRQNKIIYIDPPKENISCTRKRE